MPLTPTEAVIAAVCRAARAIPGPSAAHTRVRAPTTDSPDRVSQTYNWIGKMKILTSLRWRAEHRRRRRLHGREHLPGAWRQHDGR